MISVMSPSNDLEPRTDELASLRRTSSNVQPRSLTRSVPCIRCSEPLYYPSPRSSRTAMLCCGRCGARTRVPTLHTRLRQWVTAAIYIATLAAVLFVCLKKG